MASASASGDLVTKAKKFRGVEKIEHESVLNVAETLEKIMKFLTDHETPSTTECTHMVFDNYPDWWMGSKPTFKLSIAEDNTVETLHKFVGTLYDLNIPLTLIEKRTPEIRFLQDIEFWGNKDGTIPVSIIEPDKPFMKLIGTTMGEIFPTHEFLDVVIFDSTGVSKTKGVHKTSIRFVWSNIVVDKDRAAQIRDYMVHKFKSSEDPEVKEIFEEMQGQSKENQWHSVFNDVIYFGRYGIRMPLCDRVSPAPLKRPEGRPFKPVGVLRFNFKEGQYQGAEWVCKETEGGAGDKLERHEWLKIGCIRKETGTPLSEWTQPVWKGHLTGTNRSSAPGGSAERGERGERSGGHGGGTARSGGGLGVKIRTRSGSEGGGGVRRQPKELKEERMMTLERQFDGTKEEFIEKMQQSFERESIVEEEGNVIWKQTREGSDTGARIEMRGESRKVYIVGKPGQIRGLMVNIAPFTTEVGAAMRPRGGGAGSDGGRSVASAPRSDAGYAPSAMYTPSAVYAPSAVFAPSTAPSGFGGSIASEGGKYNDPVRRLVQKAFEPESAATELALTVGEYVLITHDPEASQGSNLHRWVYGTNEVAKTKGWFPLSYTVAPPADDAN